MHITRQGLGIWEAVFSAAMSKLFEDSGAGGVNTPTSQSNTSNLFTQISPVFQIQNSPNISPIFQQSSGSSPLNASTNQDAPATFTAKPTMDVTQTIPDTNTRNTQTVSPYQGPVYQETSQALTPPESNIMPLILGGLLLILLIR